MKKLCRNLLVWVLILSLTFSSAFAATYTAQSDAEFYGYFNKALENQESNFTITYADSELSSAIDSMQRALAAFGDASLNYDYSAYNLDGGFINASSDHYIFSGMVYHDTPEEIAYVKEQVALIVDELDIRNSNDITKIKSIYEYMTSNFVYDYTYSIFSAYDGLLGGTMVCQGYAILTSYLLEEAGLESHIVTGTSNGEAHAWNIVLYDGLWYNLDTTWDTTKTIGTPGTLAFFMKSDDDFLGHTVFSAYSQDDFLENHQKATVSYPLNTIYVSSSDTQITGLTIRLGIEAQLNTILPDGMDESAELIWTVDDPSVATITEDGRILAISTGSTWVSASSPSYPEVVSSKLPVTCVDMTTISSWAQEDIIAYYLAGGVPAALCSEYQAGLTRAELAYLVTTLMTITSGYEGFTSTLPFTDLDDVSKTYVNSIHICYYYGLMNGKSSTEFAPNDIVTREEAAAVLVRASEYIFHTTYPTSTTLNFTDNDDIASWAVESIATAQAQGLLLGNADGSFAPKAQMTREQMILTLTRVYNQYIG